MEVRALRGTDDPLTVSRVYEESWKHAYRGIVPQDYLDRIPAGFWAAGLGREGRWDLVLEEDGELIGTSRTGPSRWPDYPAFGEVVSLYLLPEYMGRGWGGPLLEAALRTLGDHGFRDALLWVLDENRRARRFYEKHGFRPSGDVMEQELGGKVLREVLYLRHIN